MLHSSYPVFSNHSSSTRWRTPRKGSRYFFMVFQKELLYAHVTARHLDKKDTPALCFDSLVGYDPNGMGYRIARLPSFEVRTALHVTFNEDHFPCITRLTRQPGSFLTPDLSRRFLDEDDGTAVVRAHVAAAAAEARPRRNRVPSRTALENIANSNMTVDEVDQIYPFYYEVAFTTVGVPHNAPLALRGPDGPQWRDALNREYAQHEKNTTLGPPTELPPNVKAIPLDGILKLKRLDNGKKVRMIIKGFRMTRGIGTGAKVSL